MHHTVFSDAIKFRNGEDLMHEIRDLLSAVTRKLNDVPSDPDDKNRVQQVAKECYQTVIDVAYKLDKIRGF